MKFMVTTQKLIVEEFEIEAGSEQEAGVLAEKAAGSNSAPGVVQTSTAIDQESIVVLDVEEYDVDKAATVRTPPHSSHNSPCVS